MVIFDCRVLLPLLLLTFSQLCHHVCIRSSLATLPLKFLDSFLCLNVSCVITHIRWHYIGKNSSKVSSLVNSLCKMTIDFLRISTLEEALGAAAQAINNIHRQHLADTTFAKRARTSAVRFQGCHWLCQQLFFFYNKKDELHTTRICSVLLGMSRF